MFASSIIFIYLLKIMHYSYLFIIKRANYFSVQNRADPGILKKAKDLLKGMANFVRFPLCYQISHSQTIEVRTLVCHSGGCDFCVGTWGKVSDHWILA